jgi:hypothetical protein
MYWVNSYNILTERVNKLEDKVLVLKNEVYVQTMGIPDINDRFSQVDRKK